MWRKLFLAAALLGICSATAQAQSTCPTIVRGAILTAAQWNQCFSAKQDGLGYTPVNRAGDTMAGRLVTVASGASRSGFSIIPGVAPTAPVNGDLWTTAAGLFARINGATVGPFSALGSTVPTVAQGDLLYGSGPSAISTLAKDTNATRYLSNTGTTNNPAWAQVNLDNGVTGNLPLSGIVNGTQDTVLGYFSTAQVSAAALSNCSTALTYNTSTHAFGCNVGTGAGTVTSVGFANTYGLSVSGSPITTSGSISAGVSLLSVNNTLVSDVLLNNTAVAFTGPSMAQGTTGTWLATGSVTLVDTAATATFLVVLTDGVTPIASTIVPSQAANVATSVTLSGVRVSPAGNIRIIVQDLTATTGKILANASGFQVDSVVSGVRFQ